MYEFADKIMREPTQAVKAITKKGVNLCVHETEHLSSEILEESKTDYKQLIKQFMMVQKKELIDKYESQYRKCLESQNTKKSQDTKKNCNQILIDAQPNSKILTERINTINFDIKPIIQFRHNSQNLLLDLKIATKTRTLNLIQKYCKKLEANQVKRCQQSITKKLQLYSKAQINELKQCNNFIPSQCLVSNQVSEECLSKKLAQFKDHQKVFIKKIESYDINEL